MKLSEALSPWKYKFRLFDGSGAHGPVETYDPNAARQFALRYVPQRPSTGLTDEDDFGDATEHDDIRIFQEPAIPGVIPGHRRWQIPPMVLIRLGEGKIIEVDGDGGWGKNLMYALDLFYGKTADKWWPTIERFLA